MSAGWGALPPLAQPQAMAQACPVPLARACPPLLLKKVWSLLAPEPSAHLPLTLAVAGVTLVLITIIPANPLPASPASHPLLKLVSSCLGWGRAKHAG